MHTHFGSAAHLAATFLGVLVVGTFWRTGWFRVLSHGMKTNNQHLQKFAKAALLQF